MIQNENTFIEFCCLCYLQEEVYNKSTKCLIKSVTEGYNATVFAYGATGRVHIEVGEGEDRGRKGEFGVVVPMCLIKSVTEGCNATVLFAYGATGKTSISGKW